MATTEPLAPYRASSSNPNTPRTHGERRRKERERERELENTSNSDLIRLLINTEWQVELMRRLILTRMELCNEQTSRLNSLIAQRDAETRRLAEAERLASETTRRLNQEIAVAEQEAMQVNEELRLYRFRLHSEQAEILSTQEAVHEDDALRLAAETRAARDRTYMREYEHAQLARIAMEEARSSGFPAGLRTGHWRAFEEGRGAADVAMEGEEIARHTTERNRPRGVLLPFRLPSDRISPAPGSAQSRSSSQNGSMPTPSSTRSHSWSQNPAVPSSVNLPRISSTNQDVRQRDLSGIHFDEPNQVHNYTDQTARIHVSSTPGTPGTPERRGGGRKDSRRVRFSPLNEQISMPMDSHATPCAAGRPPQSEHRSQTPSIASPAAPPAFPFTLSADAPPARPSAPNNLPQDDIDVRVRARAGPRSSISTGLYHGIYSPGTEGTDNHSPFLSRSSSQSPSLTTLPRPRITAFIPPSARGLKKPDYDSDDSSIVTSSASSSSSDTSTDTSASQPGQSSRSPDFGFVNHSAYIPPSYIPVIRRIYKRYGM